MVLPDVGDDLAAALEAHLQQTYDAVMLELLADGPHEDRAHWSSRRRRVPTQWILKITGDYSRISGGLYTVGREFHRGFLTFLAFALKMKR